MKCVTLLYLSILISIKHVQINVEVQEIQFRYMKTFRVFKAQAAQIL